MELWTAGMVALMILPRLCLAAVAVVCLILIREWMHPVVELVAHDVNAHPGVCTHSDADGVMDCWDGCVDDPTKTGSGICGCGVPDVDT